LIFPGLFDELGKGGSVWSAARLDRCSRLGLRVALFHGFLEVLKGLFRLFHGGVNSGFAVFAKECGAAALAFSNRRVVAYLPSSRKDAPVGAKRAAALLAIGRADRKALRIWPSL